MKKLFSIILLGALLLVGCSRKEFTDDKKCDDIGRSMHDTLADGQTYKYFDGEHRALVVKDSAECDDHYHVYSENTNDINEIGVFHAPDDKHAETLMKHCQEYVDDLKQNSRAFVSSYAPSELPKLDGAQVKRFGNYVVYTVLPTDKAEAIYEKLKSELKA